MERRNRSLIIGALAALIFLTGVYALLVANINIGGTATAGTEFKIEFSEYNISNEDKANVTLDGTRTSLHIEADLAYPGDAVTIDFTIKNTGLLSATVDDLLINENNNDDLVITINGLSAIEGTTLDVNETKTGSIVITWLSQSTNQEPEPASFDVTIDYIQTT